MSKVLKNNYKYILLSFILIIISLFTLRTKLDMIASLSMHRYLLYIIIILVGLLLSFGIFYAFKKNFKIEKIFLTIVIPIGIMYMFIIPIGRVPDEQNHFYRAYEISKGYFTSLKIETGRAGNYFSSNFKYVLDVNNNYDKELKNMNLKVDDTKEFYIFTNTSLYAFVSYLPQTIGIKIGSILNLPIFWIAMLGRITNFAFWVLLMYFSIKKMPFKKLSILVICFLPMMLQEAVSLSADTITIGMSFFLISYILSIKYDDKKKLEKKDKIILSLSAITLSLCKIVYMPLCLLMFLIPENKFINKKRKYIEIGVLAAIVVIINVIWLAISSGYLIDFNEGVNAAEQVKFILCNPIKYIEIIFVSIYSYFGIYMFGLVGGSLCNFDVVLSDIYSYLLIIILILTCALDSTKLKKYDKISMGLIILIVSALIFTSLYVQWTPVANYVVDGVQGRYFIPLLIPIITFLNITNLKFDLNSKMKYLYLVVVFINVFAIISLLIAHSV